MRRVLWGILWWILSRRGSHSLRATRLAEVTVAGLAVEEACLDGDLVGAQVALCADGGRRVGACIVPHHGVATVAEGGGGSRLSRREHGAREWLLHSLSNGDSGDLSAAVSFIAIIVVSSLVSTADDNADKHNYAGHAADKSQCASTGAAAVRRVVSRGGVII